MSYITTTGGASFGTLLQQILMADEIEIGSSPSYQLCKLIYLFHPVGLKMAESPIRMAQSQDREITVPGAPEGDVVNAFQKEWNALKMDTNILNLAAQARVYGLASLGMGTEGDDTAEPVDLKRLWERKPFFNTFDPLNTAGLIIDQNPNSPLFQKHGDLRVNGQRWHRSRTVTLQNEQPIYIAWTSSSFAYAGRSTYQRAFYPLRSFLNSMVIDDMVLRKAGLLVLRLESSSSVVDRIMLGLAGIKRALLRQAKTDNVLSIGIQESAESLNLNNIDGAVNMARNNVIKNIATGADMPAKMLTEESYVEGFGEGTEDARRVAQWIDRVRIELQPAYDWADIIVQYRAWSPEFYAGIQKKYDEEYGDISYEDAFYRWRNNFRATWPNLIKEPESALVAVDDIKLKSAIATFQVMVPVLASSPDAMAELINWLQIQINNSPRLFAGGKMALDIEELAHTLADDKDQQDSQQQMLMEAEHDKPAPAFSGRDSVGPLRRRSRKEPGEVALIADAMLRKRALQERRSLG